MQIPNRFLTGGVGHAAGLARQNLRANHGSQSGGVRLGLLGLRPSRDRFTLSPQGKLHGAMDSLSKLKEQIEKRKEEFAASAMEKGQSMDVIQSQLDAFDEQIKEIDKQIAQLSAQQKSGLMDQAKTKKAKSNLPQRPKTEQEIQNQRMERLLGLSAGLEQAEVMGAEQNKIEGNIGVQKMEIQLEKSRSGNQEHIAAMEEELAEMQNRSWRLGAEIQNQLDQTLEESQEEIKAENSTAPETKPEKPDQTEDKGETKPGRPVEDKNPADRTEAPEGTNPAAAQVQEEDSEA